MSAFLAQIRCIEQDFTGQRLLNSETPNLFIGCISTDAGNWPDRRETDVIQSAQRASGWLRDTVRGRIAQRAAGSPVSNIIEVHRDPRGLHIETLEAPRTRSGSAVSWSREKYPIAAAENCIVRQLICEPNARLYVFVVGVVVRPAVPTYTHKSFASM